MSIQQDYLAEIVRETASTSRILEQLTDEMLGWKPHSKSMSLGELAAHVVELHNWIHAALTLDEFDFQKHYKPFKVTRVQELRDALTSQHDLNLQALQSLKDEDWSKIWTLRAGDHILSQSTRTNAFRFIIQNHLVHHRGQITVYLRMLDIPVPGLYGPSADDR